MPKVIGFSKEKRKKVTCKECTAIVEYVPVEEKHYVHYDYGGGSDTIYYIDCPNCGKQITLRTY